jgi:hypothetical protein
MIKIPEDLAYKTGEILWYLFMASVAVSVSAIVIALGWRTVVEVLQWK